MLINHSKLRERSGGINGARALFLCDLEQKLKDQYSSPLVLNAQMPLEMRIAVEKQGNAARVIQTSLRNEDLFCKIRVDVAIKWSFTYDGRMGNKRLTKSQA